jgi:hypothetical protein
LEKDRFSGNVEESVRKPKEEKRMIRVETARKLRDGGLAWKPMHGDRFIEMWQGAPAVTFHGTPEWALDYLYLGETVWLPHESQLRELLQRALAPTGSDTFDLLFADGVYTCRFEWGGEAVAFPAEDAEEAYAAALLYLQKQGAAL